MRDGRPLFLDISNSLTCLVQMCVGLTLTQTQKMKKITPQNLHLGLTDGVLSLDNGLALRSWNDY